METKFNFNSQVCTDKVQSERLLALGLKKETADMNYTRLSKGDHWTLFIGLPMGYDEIPNEYLLPAWSLHRLIEMMPENVKSDDWLGVSFDDISYYHGDGEGIIGWKYYKAGNLYDCIIECYEWLIKEGYFNEEYLDKEE